MTAAPHAPIRPPRFARTLLRVFSPSDDRAFLVADLDDEFAERAAAGSLRRARAWYRGQVLRSIAPLATGRIRALRLWRDLRFATRGVASGRMHTAIAIVTLALGIGINAAVFSVLDSLLLRPLPFPAADRLVRLWNLQLPQAFTFEGFSPALVSAWRRQTDVVERVEATASASFIYEHRDGAEMIAGAYVTPGLFPFLGATPALGRVFTDGDGRPGAARLVVISESFWRQQLAADRTVIGRRLQLDGKPFEIVGVVPAAFRFPTELQQLWIPYDVEQPPPELNAGARFAAVARRPGHLTAADFEDRVKARGAGVQIQAGQPPAPQSQGTLTARAVGLADTVDARTTRSIWVLAGAVGFLLLIVCANVASLMLSRALTRARDFGVRTALGASRRDLIRTAMLEQSLITAAGAAGGLALASLMLHAATSALPESITVRAFNVADLDGRAFLFLVAASAVTLPLVCLPPVLLASRTSVADVLRQESRSATGSNAARRLRSGLVIAEVALALVLLVGAALMTRSLIKLNSIDIGLDPDGLVTTQLAMPKAGFESRQSRDQFVDTLLAELRQRADVIAVSAGAMPPHQNSVTFGVVEFAGREGDSTTPEILSAYEVAPEFFRAAGIRLIEGRDFAAAPASREVIVSAGFAAKRWPGVKAVGQQFRVGNADWLTVVGVTSEVREMSEEATNGPEIYYARGTLQGAMYATRSTSLIAGYETILLRTRRPERAADLVTQAVHTVDSRVIVSKTTLATHQFSQSIARPRIVMFLMTVFSGFGLVLAVSGIYGVLSCLVAQRLREIGVRLALGASPLQVFRLILGSGLALTAIGLAIGVVLALSLTRVMRTMLYEVDATDPVSVLAVVAILGAAAILAAWLPARRAMRVDPVSLLRDS